MWFFIHNTNAPDAASRKPAHAQAHRDYLRAAQDRMVTAGPYYDTDVRTRIGSVFPTWTRRGAGLRRSPIRAMASMRAMPSTDTTIFGPSNQTETIHEVLAG